MIIYVMLPWDCKWERSLLSCMALFCCNVSCVCVWLLWEECCVKYFSYQMTTNIYIFILLWIFVVAFRCYLWHKMQNLFSNKVKTEKFCQVDLFRKEKCVNKCFNTKNLLTLVQNWKLLMSMAGNSLQNHMTWECIDSIIMWGYAMDSWWRSHCRHCLSRIYSALKQCFLHWSVWFYFASHIWIVARFHQFTLLNTRLTDW